MNETNWLEQIRVIMSVGNLIVWGALLALRAHLLSNAEISFAKLVSTFGFYVLILYLIQTMLASLQVFFGPDYAYFLLVTGIAVRFCALSIGLTILVYYPRREKNFQGRSRE